MAIEQIVTLLVQERDRLNRAIEALEGGAKRRGRPARSAPRGGESSAGAAPKKRGWTAAQKKAQAEKMKAFWAKRRKAK